MAFKMISVKTPIRVTQCNTHILELNNTKIGTHILQLNTQTKEKNLMIIHSKNQMSKAQTRKSSKKTSQVFA